MLFTNANEQQCELNIPSYEDLFSSPSSTVNADNHGDSLNNTMGGLFGSANGPVKYSDSVDQIDTPGSHLFFGTGTIPFLSSAHGISPHGISVPFIAMATSTTDAPSSALSASSSSSSSESSELSPPTSGPQQQHLTDAGAALLPHDDRHEAHTRVTSGTGTNLTYSAPTSAAGLYFQHHVPVDTNNYNLSAPTTAGFSHNTSIHSNTSTNTSTSTLSLAAAMDKLFYHGIPENGNSSSMYILIPALENDGGVSGGSEFWVSVAWDKVIPKLFEQAELADLVLQEIEHRPALRQRAVKRFMLKTLQADTSNVQANGSEYSTSAASQLQTASDAYGTFSGNSSGSCSVQMIVDSPHQPQSDGSSSSKTGKSANDHDLFSPARVPNLWMPRPGSSADSGSASLSVSKAPAFGRTPDTPETPVTGLKPWDLSSNQLGDLSLKLPPIPSLTRESSPGSMPNSFSNPRFENAEGQPVTIMTARTDTIDPFLLAQRDVEHNTYTLEYVWSSADTTLYKAESMQGQQALTEPDSIRLVFPPRTMLMSHEKDGTPATPAYSNAHPHSNEWLKAQVCHRSCPYRAGTASLKRPKTVREHFRKCVYLDEHHPLKVLSALQLAVLERESQGLLPNRRRARVIRMATESVNKIY